MRRYGTYLSNIIVLDFFNTSVKVHSWENIWSKDLWMKMEKAALDSWLNFQVQGEEARRWHLFHKQLPK